MLKNFWYACEFSSSVTDKPKQVLMLNQRFVLYRDSQGEVIALKDQCPHRGAAFSLGKVEGDCIVCPYHGWKFQGDGTCAHIPANKAGAAIPKKARVDSYPVQEKYGFVWMFYGDLPEEERPPIPPLPEFEDLNRRKIYFEYKINAHYTRTVENDMDLSHVYLIHQNSFGNGFQPEQNIEDYKLNLQDWSGSVTVDIDSFTNAKDIFRLVFRPMHSKVKTSLSFYMPNITRVDVEFGRGKLTTFTVHLPVDDKTTMTKRVQFRNFLKFPWIDNLFQFAAYKVVMEDKKVVESEEQGVPDNLSDEIHVPCDTLSIAYRKLRQKCMAMGWSLNPNPNQSEDSNSHLLQSFTRFPQSRSKELTTNNH